MLDDWTNFLHEESKRFFDDVDKHRRAKYIRDNWIAIVAPRMKLRLAA